MERFFDFKFRKEAGLLPLFLNESFRGAAISLFYLFSSIFVYKTIYTSFHRVDLALMVVVLYHIGSEIFKFIANLYAEKFSLSYGLKEQIYIGDILLILCFITLFFSSGSLPLLVLSAELLGLASGFYWFGRHSLIAKIGDNRCFGKELGLNSVINIIFSLGTPILGGILIGMGGYPLMFLGSLFLVLTGFVFLRPMGDEKNVHDTDVGEIFHLFWEHPKGFLAYFGNSAAATIYADIFPLYVFLIIGQELKLGEFFSLSMIFAAIINLFIGRLADIKREKEKQMIALGSIPTFLIWVGRGLSTTISPLLFLDVADRLTAGFAGIPLNVLSYQKAVDGHSTGRAILYRELAIGLGSISGLAFVLTIVFLGLKLEYSFFIAAIFSLFPIVLLKQHNEKKS